MGFFKELGKIWIEANLDVKCQKIYGCSLEQFYTLIYKSDNNISYTKEEGILANKIIAIREDDK